jgi:hypothetical protein
MDREYTCLFLEPSDTHKQVHSVRKIDTFQTL